MDGVTSAGLVQLAAGAAPLVGITAVAVTAAVAGVAADAGALGVPDGAPVAGTSAVAVTAAVAGPLPVTGTAAVGAAVAGRAAACVAAGAVAAPAAFVPADCGEAQPLSKIRINSALSQMDWLVLSIRFVPFKMFPFASNSNRTLTIQVNVSASIGDRDEWEMKCGDFLTVKMRQSCAAWSTRTLPALSGKSSLQGTGPRPLRARGCGSPSRFPFP